MKQPVTLVNLFRSDRPGEVLLPLGCLALRAALEAAGHPVELRDLQRLPLDLWQDLDRLAASLDDSAAVVGLSLMADMLPLAVALTRRLHERRPERTLVLGGPGPSSVAQPLVAAFPWIDCVVRGEGEVTFPELLAALDAGALHTVSGIAAPARPDRPLLYTAPRPLIADLDALPEPRLDDLNIKDYSYFTTVASRGCRYRCTFCEIRGRQRGTARFRSPERVADELIRRHREQGIEYVAFQDDHLLHDRAWLDRLLDRVEGAGVRLRWACFARVDLVDQAYLAHLVGRGLQTITFGLEAGTDPLLQRLRKGFSVRQALSGLTAALAELPATCFFMWGFPEESLTDFFGTAQAIHHAEFLGAEVQVGQVVPLAGSLLYRRHRDALQYHEQYPFCRVIRMPAADELRELIRRHPSVFPAHHSFPTPAQTEKWRLAGGLCCRAG
ncbi:MAG: radical SAM protein [Myxococcota bacterium]|jgi:radical SAM superfamily enzyme YgiQ (UPF0313 family)|nr:radical SAM protein [Myxococcota bacterium]